MAKGSVVDLPEGVFEDECRLWKSRPGATSSFEESVAARVLFRELHALEFWNPWEFDAHAGELERAQVTMEQWERAEPGFKRKSKRQLDAKMAKRDRQFEQTRAQRETVRLVNLERYEPVREAERLELLERRSIMAHLESELAGMKSGERFPAMDPAKRAARVEELGMSLAERSTEVELLKLSVGNPEDVVDRHGHLPADRRPRMLHDYREHRIERVNALRAHLAELEVKIIDARERGQRATLKAERSSAQAKLGMLLAVPPLHADDMCADCPTPADKHGWVTPPADGPCAAWPGWASRLRAVRTILERAVKGNEARPSASARAVVQPLAVLPSGLPVAQVIQRLQELQQQFPEAEVMRGRANRWELWPKN